jgi:GxxExxY protein
MDAFTPEDKAKADEVSKSIIGAAIEVHRTLGPGLLESAYEECLCHELELRGIAFRRQVTIDIDYKGKLVRNAFRIDLLVEELVIADLKSIERFHPIHEAQILTYLRLANRWLGLVMNFNMPVLKDGIMRRVRG